MTKQTPEISSRKTKKSICSAPLTISLLANVVFIILLWHETKFTLTMVQTSSAVLKVKDEMVHKPKDNQVSTTEDKKMSKKASNNDKEAAKSQVKDFYPIAVKTLTDKVAAVEHLPICLDETQDCLYPHAKNPRCRPWGHFYHTLYNRWLGPLSTEDTEPFQFLEIGFYQGNGYDAFREFLPQAECHSIEYQRNEASQNKGFKELRKKKLIHIGNASDQTFLEEVWSKHMKRPNAPPLKIVIDDASHIAAHMAQSVLFWFPRIEPRGLLFVEDIQPIDGPNEFRTQFLPQIMSDMHYCGDDGELPDKPCFPLLQPLLASIHCEMHICVFERNDEPAFEPPLIQSSISQNTLKANRCTALKK